MCGHQAGTMNAQILTIGVGGTGPHYVVSYGWVILQSHLYIMAETRHRSPTHLPTKGRAACSCRSLARNFFPTSHK